MPQVKTRPEKLIEEIAEDLIIYLKSGKLTPDTFIESLDLNINNLEQLLRIHFVLKKDVHQFIAKLPERLRNIKTSTEKLTEFLRGEVRGEIDWQKTIKRRCKTNNLNQNTFVCQQRDRNFNIKENLVLKRLLEVIYQITIEDLKIEERNYSWLADWLDDRQLARELKEIYLKNIYLKRVNHQETKVTDRMISDTKRSRNQLYQEAAKLLEFYRRLVNVSIWGESDRKEVRKLLGNTFIKPKKADVLFELYWVINLIKANTSQAELNLMDGSSNLVASWTKEGKKYLVYHDAVDSSRLEWQVSLDELVDSKNSYLKRQVKSRELSSKLASELLGKESGDNFWAGRPDIVIEVIDLEKDKLAKVIIGEVKYTNQLTTAKQGLKELIDYLALAKREGKYLQKEELEKSEIELEGLLLVDKIKATEDKFVKGVKVFNQGTEWQTETFAEESLISIDV